MDHPRPRADLTGPVRIMLVDDDVYVRTSAARLFAQHPAVAVVGIFGEGTEALAAMDRSALDVLVVDISMPTMSGAELTRTAKAAHPRLKVLAYTSLVDQQSVSEMLDAGAAGVVYKEASIGAVVDAIQATHAGLSVLSPRFARGLVQPVLDEPLTEAETAVLRLVGRGLTNEEIAERVHLSASGVKYQINRLTEKLGAHNRVTLAVAAAHLGLLGPRTSEERSQ